MTLETNTAREANGSLDDEMVAEAAEALGKVLLIDDHVGDISWLIDFLEARGYQVDQETNEVDARAKLESVKEGESAYNLAIIDIMVSIMDIMDLVDLDDDYFEKSRETGLRLCRYARKELGISEVQLPIVCISAATDREEIQKGLEELGVPLYSRVPQAPENSIRNFLEQHLLP